MHSMVSMAVSVHVDICWIVSKFGFELLLQFERVVSFAQATMEKFDVTWMVLRVELIAQRMTDDHRATGLYQGLIAKHVEQVSKSRALHEHRIHDRVDVVGTDIWHANDQDVRLSLDRHRILLKDARKRLAMDGFCLTRPDARHSVGRCILI